MLNKKNKDNCLKHIFVCKSCYNRNRKSTKDIQTMVFREANCQPRCRDLLPRNDRTLILGPCFSRKTNRILKNFSRIPYRDFYIFTKSPFERYSNSKIKIKEIDEEIRCLNEYEKANIVFDYILGSSNCKYKDQSLISERHINLDFNFYHNSILKYQQEQNEIIVVNWFCSIKPQKIQKKYIQMFVVMIWFMLNTKNYAEKLGKMNIFVNVPIHVKRRIREDIVFVMKAKRLLLNAPPKQHFFK